MPSFHHRRWRSREPERRPSSLHPGGPAIFIFLRLLILILFAILSVQLIRLQLFQGEEYEQRADNNALRELSSPSDRGLVYDRQGRLLVENVARLSAALIPAQLPEQGEMAVYHRLASIIGVTPAEIEQRVQKHLKKESPHSPAVIKKDIDKDTALILRELEPHTPGLKLVVEANRRYPAGELVAHILGYMGELSATEHKTLRDQGYQLQDRIGKTGVENIYDALLRGQPGRKLVEIDALGRELRVISERKSVDGDNLVLTIDLDLQQRLSDALRQQVYGSDNAAAVVMDMRNGEILAMVSLPTYDNNVFSRPLSQPQLDQLQNAPGKPLLNHAISERYAPGSTFKTIVGSAALQEGIASPGTVIVSRGSISVPNQFNPSEAAVFRDWAALGALDFYGGIAMSSDVYFYYLSGGKADEGFTGLGVQRLARYAHAFGLGELTGIDLPSESAGLLPDADWKEQNYGEPWYLGDTYNFGIGQGYLAVTPLQLLTAVSAVGNGGDVLVPHLLKEVRDDHGNVVQKADREVQRQVPVDPEYLRIVKDGMRQSVTWGVASTAQVGGLSVAGKTGTAEFGPAFGDGSYETHGWFVGFAPYEDPQVAMVVFVERGGGGQQAAPVAAHIFDYLFNGSDLAQNLARGR